MRPCIYESGDGRDGKDIYIYISADDGRDIVGMVGSDMRHDGRDGRDGRDG